MIKKYNYLFLFIVYFFFSGNKLNAENFSSDQKYGFVVAPYIQQVENSSFHVLWETSLPGTGAIKLGEAEFNVLRPNLNQFFKEKTSCVFHRVAVAGLETGGNYFYQAVTIGENGDTLKGPVTPLNIPDYKKMPVSFAVIGDTQNSPDIWGKLSKLIYQERPSFIVHVGDLVQYGPHKDDWVDEFFKPAKNLLRFYPLYPAIGNHDNHHPNFYRYFDLPSPEWFYTVKKGDVLFIFADTNRDILPGSKQYQKLEKILASAHETWKIIVHHHPVYVSEEGFYGNTWVQKSVHGDPNEIHLKKLYETYGVDLVLNGHAHFYERTWPVSANRINTENGVIYITTGGGNDEYSKFAANKSWYDARTRVTNHFLYINIFENNLYGNAIDSSGNVFDTFSIQKKPDYERLNAPYFSGGSSCFLDKYTVKIQNLSETGKIFYSIDGKSLKSAGTEEVKIPIDKTTTISSFIQNEKGKSRTAIRTFKKLPVLSSGKKKAEKIKAEYFEGNWIALPDFDQLTTDRTFFLDTLSLEPIQPRAKDHFAIRFTGSFEVPQTGIYRFMIESFDGSRLIIDGREIIDNDGIHYEIRKENFVALKKGTHDFEIQYFDYVRRETLQIWTGTKPDQMKWFNNFIVKQ